MFVSLLTKKAQKELLGKSIKEVLNAKSENFSARDREVIEAVRETIEEYGRQELKSAQLNSTRVAGEYIQMILGHLKQEELWVILLDTKNQVIGQKSIFKGTLNSSIAHPREVFQFAFEVGGVARIMLAHNHPSGDTEPSSADIDFTRRMIASGKVMGIDLLDHVIIGDDINSLRETASYIWD